MPDTIQNGTNGGYGTARCTFSALNGANTVIEAKVQSIERWGSVLRLDAADRPLVSRNDLVELSFELPGTGHWTPRAMKCVGNAVQVSRDASGVWWVVVHFRQLQISPLGNGNQSEQSPEEIAGARSRTAAGASG